MFYSKKISILILTYFNEKEIELCLDSILLKMPENVEIIVLDNISKDRTRDILNQKYKYNPRIKIYLNGENVGFAKGVNQLACYASGEYLFILNPDTVADAHTYLYLADFLDKNSKVGVIGPRIVDETGIVQESWGYTLTPYSEFIGKTLHSKYLQKIPFVKNAHDNLLNRDGVVEVGWIGGAAIMIRHSLFDEIGGIDTHFFLSHADMVDLGMNIKNKGYKIILTSDVSIVHTGSKSVAHNRDKALYEAYEGTLYFFRKHYSSFVVFIVKVVYIVTSLSKFLIAGTISLFKKSPYRSISLAHGMNAWRIITNKI